MKYNNPPLVMTETEVRCQRGTIKLEDLPDPEPKCPVRLQNTTPLMERLWRIALENAERNIVEDDGSLYFGAGAEFGKAIFTRDISFSGLLGLNQMYPDIMLSSMRFCREIRKKGGLHIPIDYYHAMEKIDAPWIKSDIKNISELGEKVGGSIISRRTDDIVWLWCTADLIERNSLTEEWEWFYENGDFFFSEFYAPFFDEDDGLYRGQATFIDIHFPHNTASGYPQDWSIQDCIMMKALSTNCLYYMGILSMAKAAKCLGKPEEEKAWKERAESLKKAIRKEFEHPDGYLAYYKDQRGVLANRREALGSGLAALCGIVEGDEAKLAVGGYPVTDGGVPLFHPFFDNDRWYHNLSSWPFVDTFFIKGLEKSDGVCRADLNAALLARTCVADGSFHEVTHYPSREVMHYSDKYHKRIKGSGCQLWSAAAFIDTCFRAGLV